MSGSQSVPSGSATLPHDQGPDWAALIAHAVGRGPASIVTVVSSQLFETTVEVVFDGGPQRPGRFGVRFEVPKTIGDERWQQMAFPDTPDDWAWIAAIVEVLEPYEAVSDADIPVADAHGIRWLSHA